jgi:hypothetical protein
VHTEASKKLRETCTNGQLRFGKMGYKCNYHNRILVSCPTDYIDQLTEHSLQDDRVSKPKRNLRILCSSVTNGLRKKDSPHDAKPQMGRTRIFSHLCH